MKRLNSLRNIEHSDYSLTKEKSAICIGRIRLIPVSNFWHMQRPHQRDDNYNDSEKTLIMQRE